MTASEPGGQPRSTCSGAHGLSSSSSAMQKAYSPGCESVALSVSHGTAPPRFHSARRTARPTAALAR